MPKIEKIKISEDINIDKERQALIDDCNKQVDNQIEEICRTFL